MRCNYIAAWKNINFRDLSGKAYPLTPRFPGKLISFHEVTWKKFS